MPIEFKIPELGENVSAGDVVRVLVKPGDAIEKDQPVLELETDKATIEVPSNVSGTVAEVRVKPGDKVKVGQVVVTLGDSQAAAAPPPEAGDKKPKADEPAEARKPKEARAAAPADDTDKAAASAKAAKPGSKPVAQPAGAPEEGGLSQAVVPGRDGEDEAEYEPPQKPRGEVVDITWVIDNSSLTVNHLIQPCFNLLSENQLRVFNT